MYIINLILWCCDQWTWFRGRWQTVYSHPASSEEPIHVKEGWAVLWVLKHLCCSVRSVPRKHLLLCDNMRLVSALSKGRAQSESMNKIRRKFAAFSLVSNIAMKVRRIASERNPADKPSRWWEQDKEEDYKTFVRRPTFKPAPVFFPEAAELADHDSEARILEAPPEFEERRQFEAPLSRGETTYGLN